MNRITINDWQAIQSRKEIQNIRRLIRTEKAASWSIVFEVALLITGFCLDNVFSETQKTNGLWIAVSSVAVIVPILVFIAEVVIQKRKRNALKQVRDVHEIINMFDDEVCYYVMTAGSFLDTKIGVAKNHTNETGTDCRELRRFYIIEASYYLNKSVGILGLMKNNLGNIVERMDLNSDRIPSVSQISFYRFQNTVLLMSCMYQNIEQMLISEDDMAYILEDNRHYMRQLNDVISESNRVLHTTIPVVSIKKH